MEPTKICLCLQDEGDRVSGDPGEIVRSSKPEAMLEKRRHKLAMTWEAKDLPWLPRITRQVGGGRGLSSTYRLEFVARDVVTPPEPSSSSGDQQLAYEVRAAETALLARWLFIPEGFALSWRSWRGLTFVSLLVLVGMGMAGLFILAWSALAHPGPLRAMDLWLIVMCAFVGVGLWFGLRAFFDVVDQRIVSAPSALLSLNEAYGQLRCLRRKDTKLPGGWMSLVRITSECPSCGAAIELLPGKPDFPGRMVGRCRDAPSEHVFSFDPTTFRGRPLVAWRDG
jgi:hypothetical protein